MRIVLIEIENYRGIKSLKWAPSSGVNCLIGPGDSCKTTVLDAIELCLNPRSYLFVADDCDFFNLDCGKSVQITTTLADLPVEFKADDRYGLHLRGWDAENRNVEDEPRDGLEEAISISVVIDKSLEARWSIINERIGKSESDPPSVRYKDAKLFSTTRLGPYAERHLGWGRGSVLTQIGEAEDGLSLQLAEASRAARRAFRTGEGTAISETAKLAEILAKNFAVPIRGKYSAEIDVQGVHITSGGIALHDQNLPLRRLGTGSSRLIVSALQHEAGSGHIALIDEVEYGLEPHRIAQLLKYLGTSKGDAGTSTHQMFLTTHSPVVIRELRAEELFAVRTSNGETIISPVGANERAQKVLRTTPEAFLARRILVGEGRTEQGLARGLDAWWQRHDSKGNFALMGVVAVDGTGKDTAPTIAEYLLDLGYKVCLLLDSDVEPNAEVLARIASKGGKIIQWDGNCSTEDRIFLDVPWAGVCKLVECARDVLGDQSLLDAVNNRLKNAGLEEIADLALPASCDTEPFRRVLGKAAKNKEWFKGITGGESVAEIVGPYLARIADKPLARKLTELREWVDA